MNYIKIDRDNFLNGPGVRQVLWVSGCSHHCPHCHNPESWDENFGKIFTEEVKEQLFQLSDNTYTAGITLTGGDPFFPNNRKTILEISKQFKEKLPKKTIWAWTGFSFEQLMEQEDSREILKYIDVLVDGRFVCSRREEDLKKPNKREILMYRGSSNQRVISVQQTLKSDDGKIVLYQE